MKKIRVYLDTDTIIAAIIQPQGSTANLLKNTQIIKYLSDTSRSEIAEVVRRKKLSEISSAQIINQCRPVNIKTPEITKVADYVSDLDDQHILASAVKSKSQFLLTYNLKHYSIGRIHKELGIIVLIPAKLLQHLRS